MGTAGATSDADVVPTRHGARRGSLAVPGQEFPRSFRKAPRPGGLACRLSLRHVVQLKALFIGPGICGYANGNFQKITGGRKLLENGNPSIRCGPLVSPTFHPTCVVLAPSKISLAWHPSNHIVSSIFLSFRRITCILSVPKKCLTSVVVIEERLSFIFH